jgi:hypothetical protein
VREAELVDVVTHEARTAGSRVIAASIVMRTPSEIPTARPCTAGTLISSIPRTAMTTVEPAKTTERPAVSAASATALSG